MDYKTLLAVAVGSVMSASAMHAAANLEVNVTKEPAMQGEMKMAPIADDKMELSTSEITDEQLLNQIQDLIRGSYSQYFLKIHVMDGVVTLDGAVGSKDDESAIIAKIKDLKGVKEVKDNLIVSSQPVMSDDKTLDK